MLKQGPEPKFNLDLEAKELLKGFTSLTPKWPPKDHLIPFARQSLGVKPDQEDGWYRKAWWGFYARRLLVELRRVGREDELMALVEPIDFGPLENALLSGKGVILASSHLGPSCMTSLAIRNSKYPSLELSGNPNLSGPEFIFARTESELKKSMFLAFNHLRKNNVIAGAPDGKIGKTTRQINFLNQKIRTLTGMGELAKLSDAKTCWFGATWTSLNSIRIILSPFGEIDHTDPYYVKKWYAEYYKRLTHQIVAKPIDLGFHNGIWNTNSGGLKWFQR